MAGPIQKPAKCEVRPVIRFPRGKVQRPADIPKEIVSAYGYIVNRQNRTEEAIRALGHHLGGNHSTTMMKLKCGFDNRLQPSMTVGYKSLCTDLTNVWITGVIMSKNNKYSS
ncbi:hypothetical protein TNCV_4455461 [Trichonephila clavipes]|nr:hypothetical protein TNCV_4455461 [Trichonephila clavipes]